MSKLNFNLENQLLGKKVIITGASRGLGEAMCYALADSGAKIAMFSRSKKNLENIRKKLLNPQNHISIKLDLANLSKITFAIKKAKSFLKNIDIVIHVAGGGFGLKEPLINYKDLNKLLDINLVSVAEINRQIVKNKDKDKKLKLIHVGSIASSEAVGSVGYNVAKSALSSYVRSIGRELYKKNIIATGILPGGFISPGNSMDRFKDKNSREYKKFIKKRLPRMEMGQVSEIIPMLMFLCSEHSSMMGGCLVPIDAGEGIAYQI
jgi:NAD(P)-dependent dehydrogenase (short-subunit alcohol dehydrogenase family)|tara:strand:+ start:2818 stop:3609 length:792 start_codon:yes stop_codon:yes gene_type:complete